MEMAINLAKNGRGKVSPNPLVGCVLVKENEVIGEGWHDEFGGPHAEVQAVSNARVNPIDSTAYITLEPCCNDGKTPPCTKFLFENGIDKVVIGTMDPNPDVKGFGIKHLKSLGIQVQTSVLEEKAIALNPGYNKWIQTGKPYVIAKFAQSQDGYLGLDNKSRTKITSQYADEEIHSLRADVDAILVGRNTAEVDNPSLTVRHVSGVNPIRVVLDTHRTLPLTLDVFRDGKADTLILCSELNFKRHRTSYGTFIPVKEIGNRMLDPFSVLEVLGMEGITTLLIEGGTTVIESFISQNLIDEFHIYTSTIRLESGTLHSPEIDQHKWETTDIQTIGNDERKILKRKTECLQES